MRKTLTALALAGFLAGCASTGAPGTLNQQTKSDIAQAMTLACNAYTAAAQVATAGVTSGLIPASADPTLLSSAQVADTLCQGPLPQDLPTALASITGVTATVAQIIQKGH